MLASLATLLGLIVVLLVYDSKALFNWHGLTLNTAVSVLSTVSKTTLLFAITEAVGQWKWILFERRRRSFIDFERIDAASRGPLGGVNLLATPKTSFTRLGAIVVVLSLAYDPFSQQLVQYEQRNTDVHFPTVRASISRAQRCDKGTIFGPDGILPNATLQTSVDSAMQSAILYGLVQNYDTVLQQTTNTCPSGNCTWGPFDSLAITSSCNNVTDRMRKLSDRSGRYIGLINIGVSMSTTNATTFVLPNGLFLNNPDGYDDYALRSPTMYMTTFGTGNASQTLSFQSEDSLLWSMTILRWPNDVGSPPTDWPHVRIDALECGLFYRVVKYTASMQNGVLGEKEVIVSSAAKDPSSYQPYNEYGSNILTPIQRASIDFENITAKTARTDLRFGKDFNVSQDAVKSLSNYLHQTFADIGMGLRANSTVNGLYIRNPDGGNVVYSPNMLQILYQRENVTDMFRTLARSMTNTMRASDLDTVAAGVVRAMTTYYAIQWPWLSLHALLTFMGLIFLYSTVQCTTRVGIPVWKSSSLAPLARFDEIGRCFGPLDAIDILEEKARTNMVKLFGEVSVPHVQQPVSSAGAAINEQRPDSSAQNITQYRTGSASSSMELVNMLPPQVIHQPSLNVVPRSSEYDRDNRV